MTYSYSYNYFNWSGYNHCDPSTPAPTNPAPTTPDASSVTWKLQAGSTVVDVTATLDGKGNVVFSYSSNNSSIDLTGFYLDVNNDGGRYAAANLTDWMVGYDSDGDRMDGFDFATTIGTRWGCDANNTGGQLTVSMSKLGIDSLSDLNGAELGFNATIGSGWFKQGLRLADTGTANFPDAGGVDGEPVAGFIEMADSQIDKLILSFYVNGDPVAHTGDLNGDWYYSVEVIVPAELSEDPDAYLDQLVAELMETDPNLGANSGLRSVIVFEEDGDINNYSTHAYTNPNGEAPDGLPWYLFNDPDAILDSTTNIAGGIESSFDLSLSGDEFILA